MKTRTILITLFAFLLLAAAIGAGLNAVFTVTYVRAEFQTYSQEGETDAAELREKLDGFVGKSTTFLKLGDVESAVEEYPAFYVREIEKKYPSSVHLVVAERKECFALAHAEGGFSIFDTEGKYLYEKETNVNRIDGGENIVLSGFSFGAEEGVQGTYYPELMEAMLAMRDDLNELRANVVSVELNSVTSEERYDFFRIRMREGVVIDLINPTVAPAEKAKAAVEKYFSLSDENRIFGFITVLDDRDTGEVQEPDYSRDSRLS